MASFEPIPVVSSSGGVSNGIRPPGENDVVLGAGCNKHCGNLKFRQFIKAYKRARLQSDAKVEHVHAAEVVHFWRKLTPPGRFLAKSKNSPDGHWNEVNDKQAIRIASFFLCNQNGDELKRQKSTDAIRNSRNFQQNVQQQQAQVQVSVTQDFYGQANGMGNQLQGQAQSQSQTGNQLQGQAQYQSQAVGNMNGNMNCREDGQTADFMSSLEPMPIGPVSLSSCKAWDAGQPQQIHSSSELLKPNFNNLEQDIDFNPLPFKPNHNDEYGIDDFEPLPTTFNDPFSSYTQNMTTPNPVDMSTNAPFGGTAEQFQVSVNMVVNTMPQGYPRDNAINTVTNIQIGTGTMNEERNPNDSFLKSSFGDGVQGSNFHLKTDNNNGYIQISTQSSSASGGVDMAGPGMMNHGNTLPGFNNAGNMATGNMAQGSMNNTFERRSINLSINNVGVSQSGGDQKGSLAWNKVEVANSVPDAASLVGSFFDDW